MTLAIALIASAIAVFGVVLAHALVPRDEMPRIQRIARFPTKLSARVMFVGTRSRQLLVDCTINKPCDGQYHLPVGQPISLGVRAPESPWMAECVADMLEAWARDCEVVELEIGTGRAGARAEIAHGRSKLVFDLETISGVREFAA